MAEIIERHIHIAARPETVFAFLTDSAKFIRWKGIEAILDPKPGGVYRVNINGTDIVRGEYLEVVPPQRVVFTWGWENSSLPPPGSSRVEITLAPDITGTMLVLRHSDLPPAFLPMHNDGWDYYLPRLVSAVEHS